MFWVWFPKEILKMYLQHEILPASAFSLAAKTHKDAYANILRN